MINFQNAEFRFRPGGCSSGSEARRQLSPDRRTHVQLAPTNVLVLPKTLSGKPPCNSFQIPPKPRRSSYAGGAGSRSNKKRAGSKHTNAPVTAKCQSFLDNV